MKSKNIKIIIFLSTFLSIFIVKFPTIISFSTIILYVSAIFGYAGLMLLLWNFILGSKGVATLISKDFCSLIKTHNWIGKYGSILILIHPFLVAISYSESLLYVLIPDYSNKFNITVTYGRSAFLIIFIVWVSSAFIKGRVSYRPWRYIHLSAYIAAPFALLHIPDTGSSFSNSMFSKLYFFTILFGFIIFAILRVRGLINFDKIKYKIVFQEQINPGIFIVEIKTNSNKHISPKQGQYVYIKLHILGEDHPFTVLDYDKREKSITIAYKVYGAFTDKMSSLNINSLVYISGPYGNFTQSITDKPVVYIAAGIGITPFVSRIFKESNHREQWLFYSNKNHKMTIFNQELKSKMKSKYIPIYSRERITKDGETGHISANILIKYLDNPTLFDYYICGPQKMIEYTAKELNSIGVQDDHINYESFNF